MEEAVSASPDLVVLALAQAMEPGEEFVPIELLAITNADSNPTSTLNDMDRDNARFEAVNRDFGFLQTCRITQKPPSAEEQDRLVAMMRWLLRELREWTVVADSNCQKLAAIFVITTYCSQHGNFWPEFAASSTVNPEIVAELSKRIARLQFMSAPSSRSRTPISDKNILDRFNAADRAGDWAVVASDWSRLGDILFPDSFLSQSVRYLHAFAQNALRLATEEVRQTMPVMLLLSSLSVANCLALALASTNPYVRFGSILRLFQQQRRRNESISQTEENLLTQLLQSIATDSVQWQKWMVALNRYPLRYPQIQQSLGRALAQAPDAALQPYIGAIDLTTTGISRSTVAECLRAFRSVASLDRRKMFWRLAYERWSQWRFGEDEPTQALMKVGYCELDYAIVGYAVECLNNQERDKKCTTLLAELSSIDEEWHASATVFMQVVNRILSFFQPFAYTRQIGPDDDWLMEGRLMLPFDPQTDRYNSMFFMIRL